ncbi:glycosyltransferase family 8 protein [Psittacicella gerlachiana]|uniref:Lipopolysaccharide biosynthesis glycosyltransferase n=1 Tax=Psittacicella gerlachiana TaxID=2028574 RepID=A0A3A1YP89_9GAMM|nr:glycosyltransferase family 8 protein [Psittacicella gerlachiana]RIY37857.1 hypothetical protein CKF59_01370 [Psittacicella gerlachiana]
MTLTIVYSCNSKYWTQLATSITSLLCNRIHGTPYKIIILYRDFPDHYKQQLQKLVSSHLQIELIFYDMTSHLLMHGFLDDPQDYISSDTYSRLFIPALIEQIAGETLERVLYLDTDLVVCNDLKPLLHLPLGKHLFAGVKDQFIWRIHHAPGQHSGEQQFIDNIKHLGLSNHDYFNAGVVVFNLQRYKELNFSPYFLVQQMQAHKHCLLKDQDLLNLIAQQYGGALLLPLEYNLSAELFHNQQTTDYYRYLENRIQIIHYIGKAKPWYAPNNKLAHIYNFYFNMIFEQQLPTFWQDVDEIYQDFTFARLISLYTKN